VNTLLILTLQTNHVDNQNQFGHQNLFGHESSQKWWNIRGTSTG